VYCVEAKTGKLVWRAAAQERLGPQGTFYSTPAVAYGRVYIGSTDGKVYSYGASSGKLRWSHGTGGYVYGSPAVWRELVLVGSHDSHFYAFDAATGDVVWRFAAGGKVAGSATVIDGVVYFSTLAQKTFALDAKSGRQLWSYNDGKYAGVIGGRKRLYLTGYTRLYAMLPKKTP
jgi:outer membrane protein assembly factor BamB